MFVSYTHIIGNADLVNFPVKEGFSQLLYQVDLDAYSRPALEVVFMPEKIRHNPQYQWLWIYGNKISLASLHTEYLGVTEFIMDLENKDTWKCFYLHEWNPDISFSYIWGNKNYALEEAGNLKYLEYKSDGQQYYNVPDKVEFERGQNDYLEELKFWNKVVLGEDDVGLI